MSDERLLPNWIEGYMRYTDYNLEPPMMYRTWTALSVIAAALQRKVYLPWEKFLYPNMYIVLIGPPGHRKGSAMYPAEQLISDLGYVKLASEATTRENLIRELKNAAMMHTDPISQDTYFHSSLTIHSAELTVFLGYKNTVLMSDLCDWYDCRDRWRYRTKTQGEDNIIGVFVNLLGATTPELLQNTMSIDAIGSGLPSRIIFVYENQKGQATPGAFVTDKELRIKDLLLHDLEQIYQMSGPFKVSGAYINKYTDWYLQQANGKPPISDTRFGGYCERRATHLRKLSMLLSAARSNEMVVSGEDFLNSLKLLEQTEEKMPLTFIGLGKSHSAGILNEVTLFLSAIGETTAQELLRHFYRDLDFRTFENILAQLKGMQLIRTETDSKGVTHIKYIKPKGDECRGMFDLQSKESLK